jgi:preprotein translocase subunit SecE
VAPVSGISWPDRASTLHNSRIALTVVVMAITTIGAVDAALWQAVSTLLRR